MVTGQVVAIVVLLVLIVIVTGALVVFRRRNSTQRRINADRYRAKADKLDPPAARVEIGGVAREPRS